MRWLGSLMLLLACATVSTAQEIEPVDRETFAAVAVDYLEFVFISECSVNEAYELSCYSNPPGTISEDNRSVFWILEPSYQRYLRNPEPVEAVVSRHVKVMQGVLPVEAITGLPQFFDVTVLAKLHLPKDPTAQGAILRPLTDGYDIALMHRTNDGLEPVTEAMMDGAYFGEEEVQQVWSLALQNVWNELDWDEDGILDEVGYPFYGAEYVSDSDGFGLSVFALEETCSAETENRLYFIAFDNTYITAPLSNALGTDRIHLEAYHHIATGQAPFDTLLACIDGAWTALEPSLPE